MIHKYTHAVLGSPLDGTSLPTLAVSHYLPVGGTGNFSPRGSCCGVVWP